MGKKPQRNPQGSGSIRYRDDRGKYEVRITTGRNPGTGKQIQRSFYADTRKEADKLRQKINVDIDTGNYLEPSRVTVAEWMSTWVENYTPNLEQSTKKPQLRHKEGV